uniref:Uncharacterized protein n=1 Tax=Oryza glumipatula TaxID=40148 RepID=A0A0D9ZGG5_9ORYZ
MTVAGESGGGRLGSGNGGSELALPHVDPMATAVGRSSVEEIHRRPPPPLLLSILSASSTGSNFLSSPPPPFSLSSPSQQAAALQGWRGDG